MLNSLSLIKSIAKSCIRESSKFSNAINDASASSLFSLKEVLRIKHGPMKKNPPYCDGTRKL
jgi:hypothetical protein